MKELLLVKNIRKQRDGLNLSYDPRCFDSNLHIRLKTFKMGDVIAGFEDKLAFTLGYFIPLFIKKFPSYSVDFNIKDESDSTKNYIFSKYINEFKQSELFKELINKLSSKIAFDDIIIKPVYSKKFETTKLNQFGNVLEVVDENILGSDLDKFTEELNHYKSIESFLLDDSTSLFLSEVDESDVLNEKYLNRNARKIARDIKKNNGYKENTLW